MGDKVRGWGRLLVGLAPVGLLLAGCATPSSRPLEPAPQASLTATVDHQQHHAQESDGAVGFFSVNVEITDQGIQPFEVFVPQGRRTLLVMRNRGTLEHHYRVVGLEAADLLWEAAPEGIKEEGVTDEEHEQHHHDAAYVPWRGTSPAGIKPTGAEVHVYGGGDAAVKDAILFTPTSVGTFTVQCSLHAQITGKLTVY